MNGLILTRSSALFLDLIGIDGNTLSGRDADSDSDNSDVEDDDEQNAGDGHIPGRGTYETFEQLFPHLVEQPSKPEFVRVWRHVRTDAFHLMDLVTISKWRITGSCIWQVFRDALFEQNR
ncbi:hypothetical protein SARC_11683 [Sphaeroforma arctica JP610]|uniref:Uncharacterized protein n=1 Tax=Sphaeroforma arctica JP610 TaxID=667725 RepID=A0A0L0FG90_9EUKA|nr:hypothetical protein SARC_11683 [Sphaeroforma arctica JP610]KNC75797.1 hypothetical protein SARC_11683 [Sphaeroforma arctica JP610]|eukprot:XP_014149699.1 hypothetical protein SARC_11683 [Sphaeroforma arctica JP610]